MDYAALQAEITGDPEGIGYAGQPEWRVAELLNGKTVEAKVKVQTTRARAFLLKTGVWGGICLAADSTAAPDTLRGAAIVARDTMLHTNELDTDEPVTLAVVGAMLDGFIAAGLMNSDQKDTLLAMSDGHISRAEELGLGSVSADDVAAALAD